jgi:transglutaminase-like putative cysteine protease
MQGALRVVGSLLVLGLGLGQALALEVPPPEAGPPRMTIEPSYLIPGDRRTFSIAYTARVPEIPAGAKQVRLWLPVPQDSSVQTISALSFEGLPEPRLAREMKYGNLIASWIIEAPTAPIEVTMRFTCVRAEAKLDLARLTEDGTADAADAFKVFLDPDRLVLVDDPIRALARAAVGERATGTLAQARAIYGYVLHHMTYDKNHSGWGTGSTQHACDVMKGNCTDFHALFNSLCRAQGIASGFEIGLFLPYDRTPPAKLGGYHCWALFRVPGKSWVPVDCSEGVNQTQLADYCFGSHTSNRVALSVGRDLTLVPAQVGEPLNYFLEPYAEADGARVAAAKTWSYRDLE